MSTKLFFKKSNAEYRILWMRSLQDKIDLQKPEIVKAFCLWVHRLGYNTVVFEGAIGSKDLLSLFKKEGMRVLLSIDLRDKALPDPFDATYPQALQEALSSIFEQAGDPEAILWTSHVELFEKKRSKKRSKFLLRELVQMEAKALETIFGSNKQLFYYLPAENYEAAEKQALWMTRFAKEVADTTVIVFSATVGDLGADHMPPHPFWMRLSGKQAHPFGQFVPFVNIGAFGQGEGFWPNVALDLMERYLSRCDGKLIKGAICLSANVPKENAFLFCSLWAAAQVLDGATSVSLLVEEWLGKRKPEDLAHPHWEHLLREVREISILAVPLMRTPREIPKEEGKPLIDFLLARLKCLESLVGKGNIVVKERAGFKEYFKFFLRDMRKSLAHYLQMHQLPLLCALNEEDLKDSFWSSASGTTSSGWGPASKIWIHENACCGSDPKMAEIYDEVCGMGNE